MQQVLCSLRMSFLCVLCSFLVFGTSFSQNLGVIQYGSEDPASLQLEQFRDNRTTRANYTTSYGTPIDDPNTVLTVGPNGPMVVDATFVNEFQHMNRENIPLRVVHAKGSGAWGTFQLYRDMSRYTRARVLTEMERATPVFARFSTAFNGIAVPDTRRNALGLSLKFFTDDGNWDMLTLNTPVFFVRDPLRFITLAHSMKRNPLTYLFDSTMMWDFFTGLPEVTNGLMYYFSDVGIASSFREIDGYSVNTFALTGGESAPVFCRFHLISNQGNNYLDPDTAFRLEAADPDYYRRDLYNNIALGRFPSWNVSVQLMTMDQARNLTWNPLDSTLLWPESDFPSEAFGLLELNRNPVNAFTDVEQSGFSPSRLVPGIEPTLDRVLQGRMMVYPDANIYRLGVNAELLPVNRPQVPVGNARQRDGSARSDDNLRGTPNYYPNSYNGPVADPRGRLTPISIPGGNISRYDPQADNFWQARMFWQRLTPNQQRSFAVNVARSLIMADPQLHRRAIDMFENVSQELSAGISQALNSVGNSRK